MVLSVPLIQSLVPNVELFVEHHTESLIDPKPDCISDEYLRFVVEHDGTNQRIYHDACNWEICIVQAAVSDQVVVNSEPDCTYCVYCVSEFEQAIAAKIIEVETEVGVGLFLHLMTILDDETKSVIFTLKIYERLQ
jgi:hypothetical protein